MNLKTPFSAALVASFAFALVSLLAPVAAYALDVPEEASRLNFEAHGAEQPEIFEDWRKESPGYGIQFELPASAVKSPPPGIHDAGILLGIYEIPIENHDQPLGIYVIVVPSTKNPYGFLNLTAPPNNEWLESPNAKAYVTEGLKDFYEDPLLRFVRLADFRLSMLGEHPALELSFVTINHASKAMYVRNINVPQPGYLICFYITAFYNLPSEREPDLDFAPDIFQKFERSIVIETVDSPF